MQHRPLEDQVEEPAFEAIKSTGRSIGTCSPHHAAYMQCNESVLAQPMGGDKEGHIVYIYIAAPHHATKMQYNKSVFAQPMGGDKDGPIVRRKNKRNITQPKGRVVCLVNSKLSTCRQF